MAKTTRRVRVALGEALRAVGEIVFETDGRRQTCMFRYAAEWLDAPRRFAIAPTMPLSGMPFYSAASRERPRSALPGPIADGAPDSWGRGLIRKALPGMLTELDYLLAADDVTRQGALRYLDEEGRPLARTYPPAPRLARGRRGRRAPMEGFRTGRPPADAQRPPRRTHGDGHCANWGTRSAACRAKAGPNL